MTKPYVGYADMVARLISVTMVFQDTLGRSYSGKVMRCSVLNLLSSFTLNKDELSVVHFCYIVEQIEALLRHRLVTVFVRKASFIGAVN